MNTLFRISEKEILVNQQLYKMENITSSTNTKKIETPQKNKHSSEKLPSLAPRLGKRSGKESSLSLIICQAHPVMIVTIILHLASL